MKTILVTDDNKNIREFCRVALEEDGYRVVLASDGFEALQAFREETLNLVILDIGMPRMNGLETLERLKAIAPEVPVILFTAHDGDCLRDRRGDLASACVEKSADLTELLRTVDRVFRTTSSGRLAPLPRFGLPPAASAACAPEVAPPLGGKL
jgi:DNA-binding response OmpR family regulator